MRQKSMFDLMQAREDRDEALARVLAHHPDWAGHFYSGIAALPRGFIGTGEALRLHLKLPEPPTPKLVGSVVRLAATRGLLVFTGKMAPPTSRKSKGSETKVWRRT